MNHQVGVIKNVINFDGEDDVIEECGNLWVDPVDDTEPFEGPVTIWTLDSQRLEGILHAAAAGEPVEAILLSLEAAALTEPDEDADDWEIDDAIDADDD